MEIESDFECGNIIVETLTEQSAMLSIRADTKANSFQWFYFHMTGDANISRTFTISNASNASYPRAWAGYDVLASHDRITWQRIPTKYDGTTLSFKHKTREDSTFYAFFVPYFEYQREALINDCKASPLVQHDVIGQSVDGRPIDHLRIGGAKARHKTIWIVSRQHAGEPMAEYATEGLIRRLLDTKDVIAQSLLKKATFYIVPNMNPDGSAAGNLRANVEGIDLNRAWDKPADTCPEIVVVRNAIAETGVDYFIDMHGDEEQPFIWVIGPQIDISPKLADMQKQFDDELARLTPQLKPTPPSPVTMAEGDLGMSVDYIAATYNCPAWIIELPFKAVPDHVGDTDSLLAQGCMNFGRHCVEALNTIVK